MVKKNWLIIILLTFFVGRLIQVTPPLQELFKRNYNYENLKALYESSQYVKEEPDGWIPDNAVYNYAAGSYLRGANPIIIDPSQPPLGKYFLSLSIFLFGNTTVMVYLFFYLTLLAVFLLAKEVFKDYRLALGVVTLLLFDPLFLNQRTVMLDIFQLCFLVFSFLFFLKWFGKEKRKFLFLACLFLSMAAATKFFATTTIVFVSWLLFLFKQKKWQQIRLLIVWLGIISYLVLNLVYLRTLIEDPGVFKVVQIQKWI